MLCLTNVLTIEQMMLIRHSTADYVIAGGLLIAGIAMLNARHVGYLNVWLLLITAVVGYGIRMPITMAVLVGFVAVIVVSLISRKRYLERFENESASEEAMEKKKGSPEAHSDDPHLDVGSTLLHAYRKLNPEQVMQMRKDTQELMETQKQLIETLSSLGPQVQQGVELMDTFKGMFGKTE